MYERTPFGSDDDNNNNYLTQDDFEKDLRLVDQKLPEKLSKTKSKIKFIEDIYALYSYLKDPFVKWYRKGIVLVALLYFITPIDTIPDIAPFVGYLDDLGVIMATLKYLGSEIKPYYRCTPDKMSEEI